MLVDQEGNERGTMEKLEAHRRGELHRAFSIFVFNAQGELLLQRRALDKYHSGGLWSNTCCSHPRPGEPLSAAVQRRLVEEMGFQCPLSHRFSFIYRIDFHNGLSEHEYDHVFLGHYEGDPNPNPQEVAAWCWMAPAALQRAIAAEPARYTYWLRQSLERVLAER